MNVKREHVLINISTMLTLIKISKKSITSDRYNKLKEKYIQNIMTDDEVYEFATVLEFAILDNAKIFEV